MSTRSNQNRISQEFLSVFQKQSIDELAHDLIVDIGKFNSLYKEIESIPLPTTIKDSGKSLDRFESIIKLHSKIVKTIASIEKRVMVKPLDNWLPELKHWLFTYGSLFVYTLPVDAVGFIRGLHLGYQRTYLNGEKGFPKPVVFERVTKPIYGFGSYSLYRPVYKSWVKKGLTINGIESDYPVHRIERLELNKAKFDKVKSTAEALSVNLGKINKNAISSLDEYRDHFEKANKRRLVGSKDYLSFLNEWDLSMLQSVINVWTSVYRYVNQILTEGLVVLKKLDTKTSTESRYLSLENEDEVKETEAVEETETTETDTDSEDVEPAEDSEEESTDSEETEATEVADEDTESEDGDETDSASEDSEDSDTEPVDDTEEAEAEDEASDEEVEAVEEENAEEIAESNDESETETVDTSVEETDHADAEVQEEAEVQKEVQLSDDANTPPPQNTELVVDRPVQTLLNNFQSTSDTAKLIVSTIQNTDQQVRQGLNQELKNTILSRGIEFESIKQWNRKLGTTFESMDHLYQTAQNADTHLEQRREESLSDLVSALTVALQNHRETLTALLARSEDVIVEPSLQIDVTAVIGSVWRPAWGEFDPSQLVRHISEVARLGKRILTEYRTRSTKVLSDATQLADAFDQHYVSDIDTAVRRTLEEIGDPRDALTSTEIETPIPVIGSLWKPQTNPIPETSPYASLLNRPSAAQLLVNAEKVERQQTYARPLTKDEIRSVLTDLRSVMDVVDLETFRNQAELHRKTLFAMARQLGERAAVNDGRVRDVLQAHYVPFSQTLVEYWDLHVWPVVSYLSVISIMANAVRYYVEQSLAAKVEPMIAMVRPEEVMAVENLVQNAQSEIISDEHVASLNKDPSKELEIEVEVKLPASETEESKEITIAVEQLQTAYENYKSFLPFKDTDNPLYPVAMESVHRSLGLEDDKGIDKTGFIVLLLKTIWSAIVSFFKFMYEFFVRLFKWFFGHFTKDRKEAASSYREYVRKNDGKIEVDVRAIEKSVDDFLASLQVELDAAASNWASSESGYSKRYVVYSREQLEAVLRELKRTPENMLPFSILVQQIRKGYKLKEGIQLGSNAKTAIAVYMTTEEYAILNTPWPLLLQQMDLGLFTGVDMVMKIRHMTEASIEVVRQAISRGEVAHIDNTPLGQYRNSAFATDRVSIATVNDRYPTLMRLMASVKDRRCKTQFVPPDNDMSTVEKLAGFSKEDTERLLGSTDIEKFGSVNLSRQKSDYAETIALIDRTNKDYRKLASGESSEVVREILDIANQLLEYRKAESQFRMRYFDKQASGLNKLVDAVRLVATLDPSKYAAQIEMAFKYD